MVVRYKELRAGHCFESNKCRLGADGLKFLRKSVRTPTTRDCVEYKVEPYFELFVRSSSRFYLLHAQHPLSPHKPYISCITLNVHNVCRTSGMLSCLPYVIPSNYLVCCPIAYYFVIDDPSLTDSGRTMLCTSSLDPTPTHR